MTDLLNLVENQQTSEFYPTPKELAEKMVEGLDFDVIKTVLEPSAGKGDLIAAIAQRSRVQRRYDYTTPEVDAIEIDPQLRKILAYNFSEEKEREIRCKIDDLQDKEKFWNYEKREYENHLSETEKILLLQLREQKERFLSESLNIVHDNFLTYEAFKQYDLIIMNPPFSNGEKHLLKAIEVQKYGGSIVCLLNAETLRNPYTPARQALLQKLEEYDADIQYIKNAFENAERTARVDVALIKLSIPTLQQESDIYNKFKAAQEYEEITPETSMDLEVTDYIQNAINRYKVEIKSGIELIRQYRAFIPYMSRSFDKEDGSIGKDPILELKVHSSRDSYKTASINDYVRCVRLKYWRALLSNKKFVSRLTSKLQEEYYSKVSSFADYDFSEFNIKILVSEMNSRIKRGIEEEIEVMYDKLTAEHSWYPETKKNRHYYDGWATNKAHKIDKKVIIPTYGVFDSWDGRPRTYKVYECLSDIERILNFLDGNMTANVDLRTVIDRYIGQGITKKIPCKFFQATFYKKGTVHLVFTCPELIERFNIYVAKNKAWLPPCYGKKRYSDLTEEEKTVIDSFQGEKEYNKVLEKTDYYLAPVTSNSVLMLES